MQLRICNLTGTTQTVQSINIDGFDSYTIPTESLLTWAADLTLRMRILCNVLQIQDESGNAINTEDSQELLRALIKSEVGTS
jgi:hypothetical protein